MALDIGEHRTRGGRRAVVLCTDAPGRWPVVGYVQSSAFMIHPHVWLEDGRRFFSAKHDDDLIVVEKSPTVTIIEDDEAAE